MGCVCCKQEEIDFTQEVELSHFYLSRVIGKGAFGKVRIVQHKSDLKEYALKYISKSKCIELNATNNIMTERQILERINYPLVVNLRYAFHDQDNLFMILDLMLGGDLRFHLDRMNYFNELQVRFYVAQLILSINHIHELLIIHRDIKPDNVLLDSKGNVHLSDFNIATQLTKERPYKHNRAGSLIYMAPEILLEKKYTTDVDWWSLGVTMFEMLFGQRPFNGDTNESIRNSIINNELTIPNDIILSKECIQVLKGLLTKSPKDRLGHGTLGFRNLKSHAWFQGLDWDSLENKTAHSPFIPCKNQSNFDAVHELEELLFEEEPLRPRKRSGQANNMKELIDLENLFLPYDFTKTMETTTTNSSKPALINPKLLKRKLDESKYNTRGYYELKTYESTNDDSATTATSTDES